MADGTAPAMARLAESGALTRVTSAFPSVTGPAYAPFLTGRFPGDIGIPGLRWFDRTRCVARLPGNARSYVGAEMRLINSDMDPSPTLFELVKPSLGALSVITRGLPARNQLGRGMGFVARAALTHFGGDVGGWLAIDRATSEEVARRVREDFPRFTFAALTGIDKTSHSSGHDSPVVREAIGIVDDTVHEIRSDAERDGRWKGMHLWVCSDHGHSHVAHHHDLAGSVASMGFRTLAHPWVFTSRPEIAVMVSGNAMAHLYLDLFLNERAGWPALDTRWHSFASALLAHDSVDLILLPHGSDRCEVRSRLRGTGFVSRAAGLYSYEPESGDPLGIGPLSRLSGRDAHAATLESDYPDSLVQISHLAGAARSGDIILSAARGWDFRSKYEPIPHRSSHGALHRDHMLVPLLLGRPPARSPLRTADVMASVLTALNEPVPPGLAGESFT